MARFSSTTNDYGSSLSTVGISNSAPQEEIPPRARVLCVTFVCAACAYALLTHSLCAHDGALLVAADAGLVIAVSEILRD